MFGAILSNGGTAQESAWNFCQKLEGIYANEIGELTAKKWSSGNVLQGVMWNPASKTHGFYTFRFEQSLNDIPVFRSGIGFLVRNEKGFPVVMAGNNFKEMQGLDAASLGSIPSAVTDLMKQNAASEMVQSNLQRFSS